MRHQAVGSGGGPPLRGRRRNPRGQGQVLRAQLLQAATALLADLDSPQSLTLRMVAREVGVAPASVYSHYGHLNDLVEAVLAERYADLSAVMDEAAAAASSPLEVLVARCCAYVQWGLCHPGHYRVVFGGRTPPGTVHHAAAGRQLLEELEAALARVRSEQLSPDEFAVEDDEQHRRAGLLLWTALHGVVSLRIDKPGMTWPPIGDVVADLLILHSHAPCVPASTCTGQREAPPDIKETIARWMTPR